jgi:hypothetical protein
MKKIIGIAAIAAMVATAAFADGITVSGWGRGLFSPVAGNGKKVVTGEGVSWDAAGLSRIGFSIAGSTENVGFQTDWTGENGGVGDTAFIWVKPVKMFKAAIGRTQDDTLRGNAAFGTFDWLRIGFGGTGEDVTFTRLGNGTGGQLQGAILMLDPIEGLHIAGGVNIQGDKVSGNAVGVEAVEAFGHYGQYQIGYTIKDIGTIKGEIITKPQGTDKDGKSVNYSIINAAFDLTAVKNLFVSVGTYIPTTKVWSNGSTYDNTTEETTKVNAYVRYSFDALTLHGLVCTKIGVWDGNDTSKSAFGYAAGVGVNYNLGNGLGLVGDVRYQDKVYNKGNSNADNGDNLTFLAGIEKGFSNGKIGLGFEGGTNCAGPYTASDADADAFTWAIPLKVEYSF